MKYRIYLIFLLLALSFSIAYAQEATKPVEVNGDEVEYFPKEKKIVGEGNISIDHGDTKLTCDRIIVYTETKDADAEGNVILKSLTSEVRGQRVKYNFNTKQGEILKPRVKSGEWYGGGDTGEIVSDGSVNIKKGYITSCDREKPHYKISSKNITIHPDNKIVANNVFFKVGGMPIAYLPQYDHSLKTDWPTLNVIPGKKKKWGAFLLTSYRYEMDEKNKVTILLDEREKWGMGEGFDYKYASENFGQGILRTYYTHQRDMDRDENNSKAEEERFRVQVRHRMDIDENLTALLEYHRFSDVDFTKDYFYREEHDSESSPESYFYLLDSQPEYAMSLLTRKRVNRFQSVVERLPEVRYDLKDQELFGLPVYFKTDTNITNLNSKTANSSTDSDVFRFDSYNRVTTPLYLAGALSVAPFAGTRDTFYSKDINGDEDKLRTAFYTGVDLSTKFAKTYDASGSFLGVDYNKLRHIVTPTIEYEYIHEPSMASANLQQFDDIDSINRKSAFSLGLENKLQTKQLFDGKFRTLDLGYLRLTGDYLYRPENGSRFSNVKGDLELTPFDWLRIESDTQYDPDTKDFQSWNTELYIDESEKWQLGFSSRYWQDTEHELTSELFYKLNNEWSVRLFGRFDLKEVESNGHKIINRFGSKEITVIKDLHCWLAEVSLDVDRDGGTTVWLALKLKASPKTPFDFSDFYPYPKN